MPKMLKEQLAIVSGAKGKQELAKARLKRANFLRKKEEKANQPDKNSN